MGQLGREGRTINKLSHLRQWAAGHMGNIDHERRVGAVARALVQATLPLHALSTRDVYLLQMAAIVHDVGRSIEQKRHAAIGAKMILNDSQLPLKKRHRRALAFLTYHHRGPVPEPGGERFLRSADDTMGLRLLLGFLRAADALDSRRLPSPRLGFQLRGRCLRVTCRLGRDSSEARQVFSRRKKFRLLEEMLGCKVQLSVHAGRRLQMVA